MRVRHWITCALSISALGAASTGRASGIPSPANSSRPACIALTGSTSGMPDAAGEFTITLRTLSNNPLANATVVLDFSQCPDLRISSNQPWGGLTTDCATHQVRAISDSQGEVRFRILGAASNSGASPGAGLNCLRVFGNGVLVGYSTVQAYDQDGAGGLDPNDISLLLADLFSGTYFGRSDYDCSHALSANDLALWLTTYFGHGSTASASPLCAP